MTIKKMQEFTFVYNGVEYDVTSYSEKHPGGIKFLQNMKKQRKDFTEYFKSIHSKNAQKVLKSHPIVQSNESSKNSKEYQKIFEKVQHLFEPIWQIEVSLTVLIFASFGIACTSNYGMVSTIFFGLTQIFSGWVGHSMDHSRHVLFIKYKYVCSSIVGLTGGFGMRQWWGSKHNMHHAFTNSKLYDDDINNGIKYKLYFYPLLFIKWRYDLLEYAIKNLNYIQLGSLLINYMVIIYYYNNLVYFLLGNLISGFYAAFVLVGSHQRQHVYDQKIEHSFIDHNLNTCRDYQHTNFFWLLLMGGMQFQAQHHLFPQIPFYRLPQAVPLIRQQLRKLNKYVLQGPVI